jgi:hypothetical protein
VEDAYIHRSLVDKVKMSLIVIEERMTLKLRMRMHQVEDAYIGA